MTARASPRTSGRPRPTSTITPSASATASAPLLPTDGFPRGPFLLAENLLRNGDFARQFQGWTMLDKYEPGRPDVGGTRRLVEETIAGRAVQAMRIVRDTDKDTHNETGIVQEINRDVSAYRNVAITAWVKVNSGQPVRRRLPRLRVPGHVPRQLHRRAGRPARAGPTASTTRIRENRPTENGEIIAAGRMVPVPGRLSDLPDRPIFIRVDRDPRRPATTSTRRSRTSA